MTSRNAQFRPSRLALVGLALFFGTFSFPMLASAGGKSVTSASPGQLVADTSSMVSADSGTITLTYIAPGSQAVTGTVTVTRPTGWSDFQDDGEGDGYVAGMTGTCSVHTLQDVASPSATVTFDVTCAPKQTASFTYDAVAPAATVTTSKFAATVAFTRPKIRASLSMVPTVNVVADHVDLVVAPDTVDLVDPGTVEATATLYDAAGGLIDDDTALVISTDGDPGIGTTTATGGGTGEYVATTSVPTVTGTETVSVTDGVVSDTATFDVIDSSIV